MGEVLSFCGLRLLVLAVSGFGRGRLGAGEARDVLMVRRQGAFKPK